MFISSPVVSSETSEGSVNVVDAALTEKIETWTKEFSDSFVLENAFKNTIEDMGGSLINNIKALVAFKTSGTQKEKKLAAQFEAYCQSAGSDVKDGKKLASKFDKYIQKYAKQYGFNKDGSFITAVAVFHARAVELQKEKKASKQVSENFVKAIYDVLKPLKDGVERNTGKMDEYVAAPTGTSKDVWKYFYRNFQLLRHADLPQKLKETIQAGLNRFLECELKVFAAKANQNALPKSEAEYRLLFFAAENSAFFSSQVQEKTVQILSAYLTYRGVGDPDKAVPTNLNASLEEKHVQELCFFSAVLSRQTLPKELKDEVVKVVSNKLKALSNLVGHKINKERLELTDTDFKVLSLMYRIAQKMTPYTASNEHIARTVKGVTDLIFGSLAKQRIPHASPEVIQSYFDYFVLDLEKTQFSFDEGKYDTKRLKEIPGAKVEFVEIEKGRGFERVTLNGKDAFLALVIFAQKSMKDFVALIIPFIEPQMKIAADSKGGTQPMRGKDLASNILTAFATERFIQDHLKPIVLSAIAAVKEAFKDIPSAELTPETKAQHGEDMLRIIQEKYTGLLTGIIEKLSTQQPPTEILMLMALIGQLAEKYYPNDEKQRNGLIGGFYILRYIVPAIYTPQRYAAIMSKADYAKLNPVEQKALVTLAKMVMNVSNSTTSKDVPELNDMILSLTPVLQKAWNVFFAAGCAELAKLQQ